MATIRDAIEAARRLPPSQEPTCADPLCAVRHDHSDVLADLAGLDLSPEALYKPRPGDAAALLGDGRAWLRTKDPLRPEPCLTTSPGSPALA